MKKYFLFIIILLCGCSVKPEETIDSFMATLASKNLQNASAFCTKSFVNSIPKLPAVLRNYNYGIKKFNWDVKDIFPTTNGLSAQVIVKVIRDWPIPNIIQAFVRIDLQKQKGRWYISNMKIIIPEYIYFTTKPMENNRYFTFNFERPRWEVKTEINKNIPEFLIKYEDDCRSWIH